MSHFRRTPRLSAALRWALTCAAAFLLALSFVPAALANGPLDQQARDIAKELQCPICENNSVADSPSELATQMRGIILDQLQQGKSRQEIMDYFVARYGEGVLRDPPKEGFTLLVWWVPVVALALGAGVVAVMLRNRLGQAAVAAEAEEGPVLTEQERARYERLLEQELHERAEEGRPS